MGKFTVIPKNTFDALQMDAGVLLKNFNPDNPVAPKDEDIICATTGGINPSCVPTYSDFGEDVDNVPLNMMELKHLDSWECKIATTGLGTSAELIHLALGAADIVDGNKVVPRAAIKLTDFTDLWWVGDKANGGCVAIQLKNALSTGGFSLQTTKNAKGTVALEITGHVSINAQKEVPMVFYSIDVDSFSDCTVAPETGLATIMGVPVQDMQTGLEVNGSAITGTLEYLDDATKVLISTYGEGNFMGLKFTKLDPDATSVEAYIAPNGNDPVELVGSADSNGAFKVTDKDTQKLYVVSSDGVNTHTQEFSLKGLTLLS